MDGNTTPDIGYLTSYNATFTIEGVDRATATEIARKVRIQMEAAFAELVRDAAEAGPDRKITTRVSTPYGEEYDIAPSARH